MGHDPRLSITRVFFSLKHIFNLVYISINKYKNIIDMINVIMYRKLNFVINSIKNCIKDDVTNLELIKNCSRLHIKFYIPSLS